MDAEDDTGQPMRWLIVRVPLPRRPRTMRRMTYSFHTRYSCGRRNGCGHASNIETKIFCPIQRGRQPPSISLMTHTNEGSSHSGSVLLNIEIAQSGKHANRTSM